MTLNMRMAGLSKSRLDESIEPWLPELANRRVLKSISSELDDTVRSKGRFLAPKTKVGFGLRRKRRLQPLPARNRAKAGAFAYVFIRLAKIEYHPLSSRHSG